LFLSAGNVAFGEMLVRRLAHDEDDMKKLFLLSAAAPIASRAAALAELLT
jgi:hypothetical protein